MKPYWTERASRSRPRYAAKPLSPTVLFWVKSAQTQQVSCHYVSMKIRVLNKLVSGHEWRAFSHRLPEKIRPPVQSQTRRDAVHKELACLQCYLQFEQGDGQVSLSEGTCAFC